MLPTSAPPTILNVDDDEAGRYATSHVLRLASFRTREAGTGREALALLAERPDLVLLDVNRPDVSGLEVCRLIKADPATSLIPVLHLTATAVGASQRAHALNGGADAYLTEPVGPEELLANIHVLLRLRRANERSARLQAITAALGDALTTQEAAEAILTHALPGLGARLVPLLTEEGKSLRALHLTGYPRTWPPCGPRPAPTPPCRWPTPCATTAR